MTAGASWGTGVNSNCELSNVLGAELGSSARAARGFNPGVISPAHFSFLTCGHQRSLQVGEGIEVLKRAYMLGAFRPGPDVTLPSGYAAVPSL